MKDQSLIGDWRPVMIHVDGPITPHKVSQLKTIIGSELNHRQVNWIGVSIDSSGGDLNDCTQLAYTLADLGTTRDVQTVAYVPVEASGGAALVALACNQLVMQPEAHLGGKGSIDFDRKTLDGARLPIQSLAQINGTHSWSLMAAMVDPDIELYSYQNSTTGEVRYLSKEEWNELPAQEKKEWTQGVRIKAAGEPLRLTSNRAKELDIASQVVPTFDDFKRLYGITSEIPVAQPNWASSWSKHCRRPRWLCYCS